MVSLVVRILGLLAVFIPVQPFATPAVQPTTNLLRAHLAVSNIRSCLNYEHLLSKFTYLIDVEDCFSEDKMRTHIELISKNRAESPV